MMTADTLRANTILTGEHLYAQAIGLLLKRATQEILLFDQNLSHGDFASLEKAELFNQFLTLNPATRLTMVVQDAHYFLSHCPRLLDLYQTYQHKMTLYETNDAVKHAKDCFIVVDAQHYIKRIHIDQSRFKFAWDDAETVGALTLRFQELLEATAHTIPTTWTGL